MKTRIAIFLVITIVVASILAGCSDKAQIDNEAAVIAFTHVNLVPMTSEKILENQTVLVEGRRIIAIGPWDEVKIPRRATVIEGSGSYLMPGLADMHVHTREDWLDAEEWPAPPLSLYLANGVTTIRDCTPASLAYPLRWQDEIKDGNLDGPTLYTSGRRLFASPLEDPAGIVRDNYAQGFDFLKAYSYLTENDFREAMAVARELDFYVVGHIPYAVGLDVALEEGLDEIAHVQELFFESLEPDRAQNRAPDEWLVNLITAGYQLYGQESFGLGVEELQERHGERVSAVVGKLSGADVFVGTTMIVDKILAEKLFDPEAFLARPQTMYLSHRYMDGFLRGEDRHQIQLEGVEEVGVFLYPIQSVFLKALREAQVPILLGTDSGTSELGVAPGFSIHDELQILIENGFTPYEAIVAGTVNANRAVEAMVGQGDFGTIQVGNRADLILVGGNPLEDVTYIRHPLGVMAAGNWYSRETLEHMVAIEK